MRKLLAILAVLSLALIFSGPPALATPVTILNPSFEDPVIPSPGVGADLVDWTGVGFLGPPLSPGGRPRVPGASYSPCRMAKM